MISIPKPDGDSDPYLQREGFPTKEKYFIVSPRHSDRNILAASDRTNGLRSFLDASDIAFLQDLSHPYFPRARAASSLMEESECFFKIDINTFPLARVCI